MFEWSFMEIHNFYFFDILAKNPYRTKAIIHGFSQF